MFLRLIIGQKIPDWLHVIWLSDMGMVMNFVVLKVSVMDHPQLANTVSFSYIIVLTIFPEIFVY